MIAPPTISPEPKALDAEAKAREEAEMRERLSRAPRREGSYRIGPNDVIDIRVFRNPDMNLVARADGSGLIRFPPLGEINVTGLTERQLETLLQDRLRDKYIKDPNVTVLVSEPHPREVFVFGAVARPGLYPLVGEMRLLELLSKAGGVTGGAGTTAYVLRYDGPTTGGKEGTASENSPAERRVTIDLDGLLIRGEKHWNIPLWPGDLVNIPVPEPGWIHVTGPGVVRPGTYALITFLGLQGREVSPTGAESFVPYPLTRSSKTLRQALDEAGGVKWEANNRIQIVRKGEDGKESFVWGNYRAILKDTRNDVPLQSRDTVIVNRVPIKYATVLIYNAAVQVIRFTIYAEYDVFNQNRGAGGGGTTTAMR
jgi:polysaccharide export outer membrane protein